MKKKYKIDFDFKASITVEVDHDVMTEKNLTEINQFWWDSESRLSRVNRSVCHAVLQMLASTVLALQFNKNYNLSGVVEEFDYDKCNGIEGWPKMDGSMGIKIIAIESFCFEYDEMTIEELAN